MPRVVHEALTDVKAKDILELDVSSISNVADAIVIASGTSTRHVKALADNVVDEARKSRLFDQLVSRVNGRLNGS